MKNRLWNCTNPYQGDDLRILCVCSAGLLRSPTMARVLSREYKNVNPRAVGCDEGHALIPLDQVHATWADVILCADTYNFSEVQNLIDENKLEKEVHCLNLPDQFSFGDPVLESAILRKIQDLLQEDEETVLHELKRM